jgi:hypothetical protein
MSQNPTYMFKMSNIDSTKKGLLIELQQNYIIAPHLSVIALEESTTCSKGCRPTYILLNSLDTSQPRIC